MTNLPILPYGRQWLDDADIQAVVDVLQGDWLTQGPSIPLFETALQEAVDAPHAVAVSNGTAALHLATLAAGVQEGDVGITTAITFAASANCIRYAGGRPSLTDVDPNTGLMDVESLERLLDAHRKKNDRVKVVIPVSFTGAPVDLPAIQQRASVAGASVIEDAAHSIGATYTHEGKSYHSASCSHSDMAILSFHPVKHLTTGEGGATTCANAELLQALRDLRSHGITKDPQRLTTTDGPWFYEQQSLGFNYRLCDIQCALGVSQTKKLSKFVTRRREIAKLYDEGFASQLSEHILPLSVPGNVRSSYHLYVIRLRRRNHETIEDLAARRLHLYKGLIERGLRPQVHYIPLYRHPDYQQFGFERSDFPGAEEFYASCLSLPMFPKMADSDVDRTLDAIQQSLR